MKSLCVNYARSGVRWVFLHLDSQQADLADFALSLSLARSFSPSVGYLSLSLSLFYNVKYISVFWLRRARHFNLRRTLKTLLALSHCGAAQAVDDINPTEEKKYFSTSHRGSRVSIRTVHLPFKHECSQFLFWEPIIHACWSDKNLSICCVIKSVCAARRNFALAQFSPFMELNRNAWWSFVS